MINFLMIVGLLLLFIGLPTSIITAIVFKVKKKKIKIPVICIPLSFAVSIICLGVGGYLYGQTDEYKEQAEQREIEKEQKEEEERRMQEELEAQQEQQKQEELAEQQRIEEERQAEEKRAEEQRALEESRQLEEEERAEQERLRSEEQERLAEESMIAEQERVEQEEQNRFSYEKMDVEFIEYKIEDNAWGEKCLVVYFDFTNNSKENQTFIYAFTVKAFQNGVEMDLSTGHVNDETKNHGKEMQPGTTVTVAVAFYIEDEKSAVDIEVEPWISFANKKLFEKELVLQ